MTTTTTTTSVLRIGPLTNQLAEDLLSAILCHLKPSDRPGANKKKNTTTTTLLLSLSNKYFTAQVRLEDVVVLLLTEGASAAGEGSNDATSSSSSHNMVEDGVILVFDAQSASEFDAVAALHQHHAFGDLLRLFVGVGKREEEEEKEYSRRVLWCLDHGYEYVEADLSFEGVSSGHDDRDKEGFARIIEAIEGTVWSSAVMKSKQSQKVVSTLRREEALPRNDNPYVAPSISVAPMVSTIEDKEREEQARKSLSVENLESVNECSGSESEHKEEADKLDNHKESERKEEEDERVFQALESTIHEARRIRESSRSGELSNDERKKRAGDAAALLMNLLGQVDGSDDESD